MCVSLKSSVTNNTFYLSDNQVEGEMLLEFTDADLKDIFEVFKDRFLIRKLLRELYGPNNSSCRLAKPIAPPTVSSTVVSNPHSVIASTSLSSSQINLPSSQTFVTSTPNAIIPLPSPQITPEPILTQVTHVLPTKTVNLESYNKTSPLVIISNQQKKANPNTTLSQLTDIQNPPLHTNNFIPSEQQNSEVGLVTSLHSNPLSVSNFANTDTVIYSSPKTSDTSTTLVQQGEVQTHVIEDDDDVVDYPQNDVYIVDGWGACRIKEFTAEELLRRKVRRGRPTEAQRLGRSLLREAATTAKIWHRAPPLKMISAEKKEIFFRYICRAAPQLSRHKQFVWIRLGEALQNRRKYLSDKECGRRQMKRKHDPNLFMSAPHSLPTSPLFNTTRSTSISAASTSLLPATSLLKNELGPIVIDSSVETNLETLPTLSTEQTSNSISSVNLTTLIKEEAESEGIKYWTAT